MLSGYLTKMENTLKVPVEYRLKLGPDTLILNSLLGRKIWIEFLNQINCINCGKKIKKNYANGHCFQCYQTLASCDLCVLVPRLCHYHQGTCREPKWGEAHCMTSHLVYLSNTSGLKVGITREGQIPYRWIDQGAVSGLAIIRVKTRRHSGIIEEMLSHFISDKTDWRKMLGGNISALDLEAERDSLFVERGNLFDDMENIFDQGEMDILENELQVNISYPILAYPKKVKSLKLENNPEICGTLMGIKGQYLILDCGVINIRNHTGYKISLRFE